MLVGHLKIQIKNMRGIIMSWQDVKDFINNGFKSIWQFFRIMLSTIRGRELSKVDDGTAEAPDVVENKLQKLDEDVHRKETEFKEYFKKPSAEQNVLTAVELGLNLREALKKAKQACNELLKSNKNPDILEQLYEYETLDAKIKNIIDKWVPRALDYIAGMFEDDIIQEAIDEI